MPLFGIPENLVIADPFVGGFTLIPTAYQISLSNSGFAEVSINGLMGDKTSPDMEAVRHKMLTGFSILELMAEVSRRIKNGENKKERVKNAIR